MGYLDQLKQDMLDMKNAYKHRFSDYTSVVLITKETKQMIYYRFAGLDRIHRLKRDEFFNFYQRMDVY